MGGTDQGKKYFTKQLLAWHATDNDRSLPWKSETDPYKIWLSEVILQQTRAQQGLPYYLRFIEAYPTVSDLAAARDEEVFRLWQGLGYYNRCKNMLATARYIAGELKGGFPGTYDEILQLKGIGPYTAAAIASFAYGLPHAVVDGNVYRVLSRYFGIDTPFDTTEGKKQFSLLAQELIDKKASASYNQAIMDLGATVCLPRSPLCNNCYLEKNCVAYQQELIDVLPVRSKKLTIRTRYFHYALLRRDGKLWIRQRKGRDIWENLHEPYLVESTQPIEKEAVMKRELLKTENLHCQAIKYMGGMQQRLTHQIIDSRFFNVELGANSNIEIKHGKWVDIKDLDKFAFPQTVVSFLKNNLYF